MVNVKARYPDEAYVSIGRIDDSGSEYNGTTDISSWSESGFGQPVSSDQLWGNAKVTKREPQEDGEVSFDIVVTNKEWDNIFWNSTGSDFTSGSTRQKYRVSILVTDGTHIEPVIAGVSGSATGSIAAKAADGGLSNFSCYRVVYADAYCTSYEPEMSADEYMKASVTFTVQATDDEGIGNLRKQISTEEVGEKAGIAAFTSTNKFVDA